MTFGNPPQAAALSGVRLGGFLAGFRQNIEHSCGCCHSMLSGQ